MKMSFHSKVDIVTFLFLLYQEELNTRQAEQIVHGILQEILDGIRSPDRPASPVDAYITDEEIFSRKNPGVFIPLLIQERSTLIFSRKNNSFYGKQNILF